MYAYLYYCRDLHNEANKVDYGPRQSLMTRHLAILDQDARTHEIYCLVAQNMNPGTNLWGELSCMPDISVDLKRFDKAFKISSTAESTNARPNVTRRIAAARSPQTQSGADLAYSTDLLGLTILVREDPKEDPEEEQDMDIEEDIPPVVSPPTGSPPISPPPISGSLSNSDTTAPITSDRTIWVPPSGNIFEIEGPSSISSIPPHLLVHDMSRLRQDTDTLHGSVRTLVRGMETRTTEIAALRTGIDRVQRRMGASNVDIAFIEQAIASTEDGVLALQARADCRG
ncbi:hypothetical protein Tco_1018658 [Tanacetum coccineum]|uniref:Uncharacterized protein n=1 Tax=Tanacetum coccineum TaxID=301880 RepID=A0ABQ5FWD3_9ASTR